MRVGRRGRFVGLEMTRFHQPLRAVARFACIAALLCCCGFVPRGKHAGQTQANELEGVYVVGTLTLGGDVAIVWENGVFVYGEDVYVAGEVYAAARGCWDAVVWKNGVPQVQEASETGNAQVTAMVVSNGDVYVTGYVYQYTGHQGHSCNMEKRSADPADRRKCGSHCRSCGRFGQRRVCGWHGW